MQRFLLLALALAVDGSAIKHHRLHEGAPPCPLDVTKVNNVYYIKDKPINITGIPSDISIHWRSHRVFFTLIGDDYLKMKLQILKNGFIETIKVPGVGQSTTVDNKNDIIYLATDNGVYKYQDDGTTTPYAAPGEDVMYLAASNDGSSLYIATWPHNRVHVVTDDGKKQETFPRIPNGHDLTIDTKNNIYFVAAKTSYILQAGNSIPMRIKGLPMDIMTGIFVSKSGNVYGMDEIGKIYMIDPINAEATLLGAFNVNGVNAFGMDAYENVVIGVKGAILRFHQTDHAPCSEYEAEEK